MKRDTYWQMIRGICIIAVIMIHCPTTLNSPSSASLLSWITVRSIVNFPVPVFFFLAGYFAQSSVKKFRSGVQYCVRRSWRLIVPYTVWSVLSVSVLAAFRHEPVPITSFLIKYFTGRTVAPFYFIAVLFQLTLATPILSDLVNRRSRLVYAVYGLHFAALAAVYSLALTSNGVLHYCYSLPFVWVGFYALGMQLRAADESEGSYPLIRRLVSGVFSSPLFLSAAIAFNWLESCILLKYSAPPILAVCQFRIGGILYSVSLIAVMYRFRGTEVRGQLQRALAYIGDISYGMFLVHYLAVLAASQFISRFFPGFPWCAVFLFSFTFAFLASMLVVSTARRVFQGERGRKFLRVLGFA